MEMMNDDEEEIDWLDLPLDLLAQITDKVISFLSLPDYVRFGCVCVQWRSFLIENNNYYEQIKLLSSSSNFLPVLLIPSLDMDHHHHTSYKKEQENDNNNQYITSNYYNPKDIWRGLDYEQRHHNTRSFYNLFEGKVYDFQLPVPSYMNCRGSSHGWLVLVKERRDGTYPVHLFNPFRSPTQKNNNNNNKKIHLPPLTPTHNNSTTPMNSYNLIKVIFSGDPSTTLSSSTTITTSTTNTNDDDDQLVVLGYHLCTMVFCRPGDEVWTQFPAPYHSPTFDVIFYKGQFWGILQNGSAVVFDIAPEPNFTTLVDPHPEDYSYPLSRYLVESAGDLFHVRRDHHYGPDDMYSTVGFQVFKLDPVTMEWVKTNTLDGCMFFLGDNASMSFSVVDNFPEWCKPNSIYFTDDYYESHCARPWIGPHDIGVFNSQSGSFESLYTMNSKPILPASPIMPSPIWIQLNPY